MRNLKRALSLLLASIMLIGMMVVGASAADSYDDFTDKDEIVNKDAVAMLTTLKIINGKEDGSYFDPTGDVTRAEMAKMISVILNKGVDIKSQYETMDSGLKDISGHWAAGNINYCYTLDIIAGRGDGTFDPDAKVTAVEAAKMLLVAAGYDASIEGLTGASWSFNTSALAARLNIFDGYTKDLTAVLNRDDAALLIYNALDIELIQKYEDGYAIEFSDSRTVLSFYYGVFKLTGVVLANQYASLEGSEGQGTDMDATNVNGKTLLGNVREYASTTLNTTNNQGYIEHKGTVNFNVETPVELLGKTIMMYVRKTTILANSEVLGVYLDESLNNVKESSARVGKMEDFLKGTGMSTNATTKYYVNYGIMGAGAAGYDAAADELKLNNTDVENGQDMKANRNGIELTVIDNNDDGVAEYVLYVQEDLTQITALNESKETISFLSDSTKDITKYKGGKTIDLEDVTLFDGADEGDLVLVRTYGGHWYVTEPDVISGEMESYSANKTAEQWIKVDGETYKPSFIEVTAGEEVTDIHTFDVSKCAKSGTTPAGVQWDIDYDFYLDSHGYIAAFKPTEKGRSNYALVVESGYNPGVYASDASGKITVVLADGTEGTYELNFSASAKNVGEQVVASKRNGSTANYTKELGVQELKGFLGTDYTDNSSTRPWTAEVVGSSDQVFANQDNNSSSGTVDARDYPAGRAAGYVITYSLNENDVLTIKSIVGSATRTLGATLGADAPSIANVGTSATAGGYKSGAAQLNWYTGTPSSGKIAIDEDTVAFYYTEDRNGKPDKYGAAVGYSSMSDVDPGKPFIVKKVGTTNLADVLLFNQEGKVTQKDYVLILERNDHSQSGNNIELYGILEDGSDVILTITRDNYEDMGMDNDNNYAVVYAYSTNANGISTLAKAGEQVTSGTDTRVVGNLNDKAGYSMRLTNQTVAFDTDFNGFSKSDYNDSYALPNNGQIWDITDGEGGHKGAISENRPVHSILILDSTETRVVTAFVWNLSSDEYNEWRDSLSGTPKPQPPVSQGDFKAVLKNNTFTYENVPVDATIDDYLAVLQNMVGESWTIKSTHMNTAGVVDSITVENTTGVQITYTLGTNTNPDPITVVKPNQGDDVPVKPVANQVPDSGDSLAAGTMPGFSSMLGIDANGVSGKLTAMTVKLPLDGGKYYAVKETNSALATCYVDGGATGTAGKDNGKYVKFATLVNPAAAAPTAGSTFNLAVLVTDDGAPITLGVYSASTPIYDTSDQTAGKDRGDSWKNVYDAATGSTPHAGLTLEYTVTIDTTGITFSSGT